MRHREIGQASFPSALGPAESVDSPLPLAYRSHFPPRRKLPLRYKAACQLLTSLIPSLTRSTMAPTTILTVASHSQAQITHMHMNASTAHHSPALHSISIPTQFFQRPPRAPKMLTVPLPKVSPIIPNASGMSSSNFRVDSISSPL